MSSTATSASGRISSAPSTTWRRDSCAAPRFDDPARVLADPATVAFPIAASPRIGSTRLDHPPAIRSHHAATAETISPRWPTGHRVAISREIWPLLGSRDLWHCEPPRPADVLLVSGMARAICLNSLAFPQPITKRDGPCRCSAAIKMADTTSGVVGDPVSGSMTGYRLEGVTAEDPDRSRSAASAA